MCIKICTKKSANSASSMVSFFGDWMLILNLSQVTPFERALLAQFFYKYLQCKFDPNSTEISAFFKLIYSTAENWCK